MHTHTQARSGGGAGERACLGEGVAREKVKGGVSPRGVLSLWVCVVHSACLSLGRDCLILVERNPQIKCRGD